MPSSAKATATNKNNIDIRIVLDKVKAAKKRRPRRAGGSDGSSAPPPPPPAPSQSVQMIVPPPMPPPPLQQTYSMSSRPYAMPAQQVLTPTVDFNELQDNYAVQQQNFQEQLAQLTSQMGGVMAAMGVPPNQGVSSDEALPVRRPRPAEPDQYITPSASAVDVVPDSLAQSGDTTRMPTIYTNDVFDQPMSPGWIRRAPQAQPEPPAPAMAAVEAVAPSMTEDTVEGEPALNTAAAGTSAVPYLGTSVRRTDGRTVPSIINPYTGYSVQIGGKAYIRAVKEGLINEATNRYTDIGELVARVQRNGSSRPYAGLTNEEVLKYKTWWSRRHSPM